MKRETYNRTIELARRARIESLKMVHNARASHIASALSIIDILAVLYEEILNVFPADPDNPIRDRFILSKGHACVGVYAILAERGFFPLDWLNTSGENNSHLGGHVTYNVPGVELSTGSLGHGLPVGCGMAIASKRDKKDYRIFVLLSDGELDEGSNWEAALFASQHHLNNLVGIIDYNKIQGFGNVHEIINLDPLMEKFRSFGWAVKEIDGHDLDQISNSLEYIPFEKGKPSMVIAHTIKGKGVSFMENQLAWHYKSPNDDELILALKELEETA